MHETMMQPDLIIRLPNGLPLSFQKIELNRFVRDGLQPGEFRMGSRGYNNNEEPIHIVRISKDFFLGTFPVMLDQFLAFRPEHENHFKSQGDLPVESVSWQDAMKYCDWLNSNLQDQLPPGFIVTLPFESHWEYACRAGVDGKNFNGDGEYFNGDGVGALHESGWFVENSEDQTHAVGLKAENGFGLYDMHGNVEEWCLDGWDQHAYKRRMDGMVDPFVPGDDSNANRVLRGGCWNDSARYCRSGYRLGGGPGYRYWFQGFRVCLFPGPLPRHTRAKRDESVQASRDDVGPPRSPREASENILKNERFPSEKN